MSYEKFIRLPEVQERTGLSKSSIYLRIQQGIFPPPVKLGLRASGWPEREVEAVNRAAIIGLSTEDLQVLVNCLLNDRKNALSFAKEVSK